MHPCLPLLFSADDAIDSSVCSKNKGGAVGGLVALVPDLLPLQVQCLFSDWNISPGKHIALLREKFLEYCHMTKCITAWNSVKQVVINNYLISFHNILHVFIYVYSICKHLLILVLFSFCICFGWWILKPFHLLLFLKDLFKISLQQLDLFLVFQYDELFIFLKHRF